MSTIKLLTPIFAPKTWGNTQAIIDFIGADLGFKEPIGEIFLASGLSTAEGGSTLIDKTSLRDLFADEKIKTKWFGEAFQNTEEFPILLKVLTVKEPLSLQVHPGDELLGNKRIPGKTEGWYALNDSQVLCGFKDGFTQKDFNSLLNNKFFEKKHSVKDLLSYFNLIDLKQGETLYVESGTVHTILSGTLLEPQQPCNTTFRIYDWGRNDPSRPLHLNKALTVINYSSQPQKASGTGVFFSKPNFNVEHIQVQNSITRKLELDRFHLVLPIRDPIKVNEQLIAAGQCALVLADTEAVYIENKNPSEVFLFTPK